jgi:hypothetical protein
MEASLAFHKNGWNFQRARTSNGLMRTALVIGCLAVALVTTAAARLRTAPRSTEKVAASANAEPLAVQEAPAAHTVSAPAPSLPWLDVGPEDEEPPPIMVKKRVSPVPEIAARAERPSPQERLKEMRQSWAERRRQFLVKMLRYEMPALNLCYANAQLRHRYLRRDVRLILTITEQQNGDSQLESVQIDVDGYRPPAFEKCMQQALSELMLPSVDGRLTATIPITLNPDEAAPVENDEETAEDDSDD